MEIVRYGIIGLGNQGSSYARNIFETGRDGSVVDAVLSAVCDINPAKIESFKKKTTREDLVYFSDYKEMLDSGLCDAVLVETPHYQHPEIVIECLKRGMHVICEKPAGVYTKQVKEMNEAAKDSKSLFALMFNQRTNCVYRKMKEIIAEGGIGELQRVNWIITDWFRTQKYYDSGSWRATWAGEGGGVLINQCPHQIDLVQWVVGEMPVSVTGFCQYGKWHDIEVEDEVTAFFKYKNGATGVFITTTGEAPGTNRLEISGTKGKLLSEGGKTLTWYKNDVDSQEHSKTSAEGFKKPAMEIIEVETDGKNPQHAGIINNFTAAILGKEPLFVDGKDGINGVELMNAIELSGWNNAEEIILPIDEDRYLRELNAHRAVSKIKTTEDAEAANTSGTY
ncbi:MAG: Gfo/Idh/MocA family oxidoreductase [Ruminococcaceae bacterium]|nr:Gfo/Idh/MocA family oxidoreductase [Oscillospiraceae bacterium]